MRAKSFFSGQGSAAFQLNSNMKIIVKTLLISSAALGMSLQAAEFTTTVQQGTAAHWAQNIWQPGAVSPTAGNTYVALAGGNPTRLRNPASGSGDAVIGVKTFPGDSLQLDTGSEIRAKGPGTPANTLGFPGVGGNPGLILNGGNLDNGDNGAIFGLTGVVLVQADSSFTCGDSGANNTRGWLVGAQIRGSANISITKNFADGPPSVELTGTNNPFSGNWIINGGHFKATAPGSLGSGNITINPGTAGAVFEPMYDIVSPGTLTLAAGNTVMRLHQTCSFVAVVIDDVPLFDGTYDYDSLSVSYPGHFPPGAGSGAIIIQPPPPPAAPANLSVLNGDTQVTLNWSASSTATGYNVKRSATAGGPYTSVGTPSNTSFVDTGLVNGSTYYYVVSASNAGGEGPNSTEVIARPNNTVTGVTATGGTGQVSVAWSSYPGATSYLVKRAANSGGPYADVATVTGTSHVDTTVEGGRNYFYVVLANLAGGAQSGISSEAAATTAPSASSLTARPFAATVVSLRWSNLAPLITQFLLERSADGLTFEPLVTVPGNQTNYTDSGLAPGTTFFYRVQAQNAAGFSPYSNVASNTTPAVGFNINFANALNGTPANNPAPIPPGYAQDIGEIFGPRTNGLTYGWDRDITVDSRYRNNANSPDLRYDTFNHLQKLLPSAIWEIELPVGFYSVRIVSGDPTAVDSTFQMNVEGVDGPSYVPVGGAWWADTTIETGVGDGRLTINSGPRAANNKINFIDIYPAVPKPPVIGTQPAGGATEESHPLNLSVVMSQGSPPLVYQWYLNGTPITDATNAAYSVPRARSTDAGAYSVIITNWGGAITSAVANVTVPPDTTAPQMVSMASVDGKTIGVCFSEEIENSAGQMTDYFNYTINNGAMFAQSITLRPDRRSVILHLANPITGEFTVGVNTVNPTHADFAGNPVPPTTLTNRVTDWFAGDVGGPGLLGQHYTCDLSEFEVVGGGADIWGASDQFYLISRPVTGNFDARVRVTGLTGSNAITKAVLVARESTNGNDRAYHISVNPTPPGRNQLELGLRSTVGGATAAWGGVHTNANIPNTWMRITRVGQTFTGYRSVDGTTWIPMGTNTLAVAMPATMAIGIGVTAHDNSLLATGMFSNFTISQGAAPPRIVNMSYSGGRFDLGFATESGATYRVEYKNDLNDATWTTLTTVTGDGNPAALNDPTATVPRRFYRIRVE
jgi:hypothetical protein